MDNPRAERVRAVAHLASAAGRRRAGQFLVEGPHAVADLLRAMTVDPGRWRVAAVYATAQALGRADGRAIRAAAGDRLVEVTDRVMAVMADADSPQGIVAVVSLPPAGRLPQQDLMLPATGYGAGLVDVRDPGNVGTVIRAADAAGAGVLALTSGCADLFAPKVVRATAGSLFHVPVQLMPAGRDVIESARRHGWRVLATAADGRLSLDELADQAARGHGPLHQPHLWLLGNEAHGLAPEVIASADAVVRVPIRGRAESLNLAMAATLVLFASARHALDAPVAARSPAP